MKKRKHRFKNCIICDNEIPNDRQGSAITCSKKCSTKYLSISTYINSIKKNNEIKRSLR